MNTASNMNTIQAYSIIDVNLLNDIVPASLIKLRCGLFVHRLITV